MRLLMAGLGDDMAQSLGLVAERAGIVAWRAEIADVPVSLRVDDVGALVIDPTAEDHEGLSVARRARRANYSGAILFTASDPPPAVVVDWLAVADDVVRTPVDLHEAVARLRAIERRRSGFATGRIDIGPVSVDTAAQVVEVGGRDLALSPIEYRMIELFMLRSGRCVTKENLLDNIYDGRDEPEAKIIDVMVCRLRGKLAGRGVPSDFIETVWGRGYLVRRPRAAAEQAA